MFARARSFCRPLLLCLPVFAGTALATTVAASTASAAAPDKTCAEIIFAGNAYIVCTIDLTTTSLRLHWKDTGGVPYGNVGTLARALNRTGRPVVMAVNAGMYHADGSPVGLYIEDGQQLKKANTAGGPGNFHMKPNGVFYVATDTAGVMETSKFLKAKPRADFATQSGPMLVIDGKIHPALFSLRPLAQGPQRRRRPRSPHCDLRHLQRRRLVRRLRPPVPRRPELP